MKILVPSLSKFTTAIASRFSYVVDAHVLPVLENNKPSNLAPQRFGPEHTVRSRRNSHLFLQKNIRVGEIIMCFHSETLTVGPLRPAPSESSEHPPRKLPWRGEVEHTRYSISRIFGVGSEGFRNIGSFERLLLALNVLGRLTSDGATRNTHLSDRCWYQTTFILILNLSATGN